MHHIDFIYNVSTFIILKLIRIFANHKTMDHQNEHIAILKQLSTLDAGTFTLGKGQYQVKTTARDVIEAGKRLEELGIFNFGESKNEIKITVEYFDAKDQPLTGTDKPKKKPKK